MYRKIFMVVALILGAGVVACQPEEPSDEAMDHLENAGEEIKKAGEDVANAVEDACENAREEAGAKDTDC